MRRRKILLVIIALLVLAAGIFVAANALQKDEKPVESPQQSLAKGTKTACELLTLSDVKAFLGSGARKINVPGSSPASTEDIRVTSCAYDDGTSSTKDMSLMVRGAQSEDAYFTNRYGFADARTVEGDSEIASEDIPNLGQAYYNPASDQVNILVEKGQYWLIIQSSDRDTSRKVGHKILDRIE